jgi:hypothetical protein
MAYGQQEVQQGGKPRGCHHATICDSSAEFEWLKQK